MSDQNTAQSQSNDDAAQITDNQKLNIFSAILDEVEQTASDQTSSDASAQSIGGTHKEHLEGFSAASQELPGGMQRVESEPNLEIPPELESYLEKVEESDQKEAAQKLADLSQQFETGEVARDPTSAKVLPITKQQEKIGFRKSAAYSIRWLVEFSHKMTKMFLGRAVYRQPDSETTN